MVYDWIVFLHVAGVLMFMLAHGAAASVGLRLRRERDVERIRTLLDLSTASYTALVGSLLWILATGIVLGILGEWWRTGWFWASLIIFVVLGSVMTPLVATPYNKVRNALGLKVPWRRRGEASEPPTEGVDVDALLASAHPVVAAVLGIVGVIVLVWLMMFKPF